MKLFSKEVKPCCVYCAHSYQINEDDVLCPKRGIVSPNYKCRKYVYDPTKRVPPKPAVFESESFSAEDFKLD